MHDSNKSEWHIGLCDEPYGLTLNLVKRTSNCWMYIETGTHQTAQEVINYCTNKIGFIPDFSNSNKTAANNSGRIIYIYRK